MFHRILKWVLWLTGILCLILALLAAGLFFAPNMVSTDWFRHQFETRATQTLHRPITVKDLKWSWKEGIRIKGLEAADDPQYAKGPLLSVDELLISVDFELGPKRLLVNLEVDGIKANLIRNQDGRTNLEAWLARLKRPREPAKPAEPALGTPETEEPVTPLVLPGDLAAEIKLSNVQLRVEDRMDNRLLQIHEGAFNLDMPSLLSKPVTLNINSHQSMDGKVLPALDLAFRADGLVDATGALNLEAANLNINGELPGVHMAMKGSMAQKGIEGDLKLDLAPLTETVLPFMSGAIPQLSGEILLQTKAALQRDQYIGFDLRFICNNILAAGGPLKEKRIGPLSMSMTQKGSVALSDKTLYLKSGGIHLFKKSGLSFEGSIKMAEKSRMIVDLAFNQVVLHMDEIQHLIKEFIPHGMGWKTMNKGQDPDFSIKEVQINGILPDGEANLSVQDMALNLAKLQLAISEDPLTVEDLTLRIPHTAVQLKNRFPENLDMRLSLGAQNIRIPGKQTVLLNECRVSSLDVAIKDLGLSPEALWGMTGRITLEESGLMKGIRLVPQNDGTDLFSHGFKANIDLPPAHEARVRFAEADLSLAPLKMTAILPRPLEEGLTLKGHVKDVRISALNPIRLDVGTAKVDIRSGDVLEFHAQGAASDSGMKGFRTEGRMGINLYQVLKLVPPTLNPKGRFSGRVETQWQLQGRRPTQKEIAGLTDKTLSLEKRMRHGRFLGKMDLQTNFTNLSVTLPLNSGETFSARGLHTENPINISSANGLESISATGKLKVDKITALPSFGKLKTPLAADLSFNAVSRNLNSLELRETLHLAPLAVTQTLELSLNKFNRLLRRKDKPDLSALLKTVEAKIRAGISVNTGTGLAPFTRGMTLQGPVKGGLAVQLRGGKSLFITTNLESDGINAALPSKFTIDNLRTHLQLEKTYDFAFGPLKPEVEKSKKRLSMSVLQPEESSRLRSSVTNPFSQRLVEDLRGRLSGKPTLSFTRARLENRPFPILLKNAQMQMRLNHVPSIDYFQMDVMGGTLLGALSILSHNDRYRLQMDGAFSGLDAQRLLERRNVRNPGNERGINEDTRISGRMSLQIPITANAGTVMGNLNMVFRLTHIGARTLERLLYAMDPHENNESIVRQRALLKKGTPRFVEVVIKNGSLSLTGEVTVAGSNIRLPAIKRLNMASLPIQTRMQALAGRLVPLLKGLKMLSANTLRVEQGGVIHFTEDRK